MRKDDKTSIDLLRAQEELDATPNSGQRKTGKRRSPVTSAGLERSIAKPIQRQRFEDAWPRSTWPDGIEENEGGIRRSCSSFSAAGSGRRIVPAITIPLLWKSRAPITSPRLIAPPGSKVVWRAGRSGLIEFSQDGGSTWSRQTSGVLVDLPHRLGSLRSSVLDRWPRRRHSSYHRRRRALESGAAAARRRISAESALPMRSTS